MHVKFGTEMIIINIPAYVHGMLCVNNYWPIGGSYVKFGTEIINIHSHYVWITAWQ